MKQKALNKRIKQINKEITAVSADIKVLSKAAEKGVHINDLPRLKSEKIIRSREEAGQKNVVAEQPVARMEPKPGRQQHNGMEAERIVQEKTKHVVRKQDERLKDFLATNFQSVGPLRYERQRQRNKAIVVIIAVILIFLWMWMKFS